MSEAAHHCCHSEPEAPLRLGRKLKIALAALGGLFAISFLPVLAPLNQALIEYLGMIWWAIALGLLVGGLIDWYVPSGFVQRWLGSGRGSLLRAVLAGFLMAACSHGILAIAMQLYKKGAAVPAVITFLLASPWANLPITILLFSFFGWQALWIVGTAMVIALTTGLAFTALDKAGWIEPARPASELDGGSWRPRGEWFSREAGRGVLRGALDLANMVLWWLIVGFIAAALIKAYVPQHLFMDYLGPGMAGLLLTLLAATVIEICSEGSSPIAFELYRQTGALGNPFVFLMAGVVTDYTEIGLLWTTIGKRTALWLPVIAVPQVLLAGWLFNVFF
jgi:uncharacterized membrane protein YraQ (UPF0718 family)